MMKKIILFLALFLSFFCFANAETNYTAYQTDYRLNFFSFSSPDKSKIYYLSNQYLFDNSYDQNKNKLFEVPANNDERSLGYHSAIRTSKGYIFILRAGSKISFLFYDNETDTFTKIPGFFTLGASTYYYDTSVTIINGSVNFRFVHRDNQHPTKYFDFLFSDPVNTFSENTTDGASFFDNYDFFPLTKNGSPTGGSYMTNTSIYYYDNLTNFYNVINYKLSDNTFIRNQYSLDFPNLFDGIEDSAGYISDFNRSGAVLHFEIVPYGDNQIILSMSTISSRRFFSCVDVDVSSGSFNCKYKLPNLYAFDVYGTEVYSIPQSTSYRRIQNTPFLVDLQILGDTKFTYYLGADNSLYRGNSDPDTTNTITVNVPSDSTLTKTCENLLLPYPYNLPYTNLDNNDLDVSYSSNAVTLQYTRMNSKRTTFFSVNNIDNFENFNSNTINQSPIVFNPSNNFGRFFGSIVSDYNGWPYISISGNFDGRGFFKIDGNGPEENLGYEFDCDKKQPNFDKSFNFGEEYTFNSNRVCILLTAAVGNTTFDSFSFGTVETQIVEKEVCRLSDGSVTLGGQPFDGDLENPSNRTIIEEYVAKEEEKNIFQKLLDFIATFFSILDPYNKDSVYEKIPYLGEIVPLFVITYPEEPTSYQVDLPYLKPDFVNGKASLVHGETTTTLPKIESSLNIGYTEPTNIGPQKQFISVLLAFVYIFTRIAIISLLLLPFYYYFKYTNNLIFTIFGSTLSSSSSSGDFTGIASKTAHFVLYAGIYSVGATFLFSLLNLSGIFTNGITILNSIFGVLLTSFFDYNTFFITVNGFFTLFVGTLIYNIIIRIIKA